MTNFLVKHFVRNYQNTEDLEVRTAYGILAGVVGIICNMFLFAVKFISGSLLHSVAIMNKAFNFSFYSSTTLLFYKDNNYEQKYIFNFALHQQTAGEGRRNSQHTLPQHR